MTDWQRFENEERRKAESRKAAVSDALKRQRVPSKKAVTALADGVNSATMGEFEDELLLLVLAFERAVRASKAPAGDRPPIARLRRP